MGCYWNIGIILLLIVNVSKCFSISIEAPGNAVQGEEYTLRCAVSSSKVIWFKKTITIAWSIDTFINDKPSNNSGCYFHNIPDTNLYEFKDCGVKHELTIKYLDYNRDNGVDWSCQSSEGGQRATLTLLVKVQPTLYNVENNNTLVAGQNGTFSLKYWEDMSVNVSWYHNETDLQTSGRITIREESTEISHLYNNNIKLSGIKTILTITSITITDQGIYTCQVCNQYGCSRETFQLDLVLEKRMKADEEDNMDTTILGISIGLTALFICIIVIVISVVCKRKTKSNGGSPLPVITENELYVSSDMVIEQPHSSDTVPVQKPVEMEIIENDLYISSDLVVDGNKIQDPPIYGQINKVTPKRLCLLFTYRKKCHSRQCH